MNTIIQCSKADLVAMWCEQLEQMQAEANRNAGAKAQESLLTAEEVIETLKISQPTLWRWQKGGYITPIYVGGKRRFKRSDVMAIIEQGGVR